MIKKHGDKTNGFIDNVYGRFVEGWLGDMTIAEENFDKMIEWTIPRGIWVKKPWDEKKIWADCAYQFIGPSYSGRFIALVTIKKYFPANYTIEEMARFAFLFNNYCAMKSQTHDEYIYIVDTDGFASENMDMDKMKIMVPLVGNILPQCQFKTFIVRAGWTIKLAYQAATPFIHPRTRPKLFVLGSGFDEMHAAMDEYLDMKMLPTYLGGENTNFND